MRKSNKAYFLLGTVFVLMFSVVYSLQGLGGKAMRTSEVTADNKIYLPVLHKQRIMKTMTATSNVADGEVLNLYCTNWETCRAATSSNNYWQGVEVGTVGASLDSKYAYFIQRIFYFFDTATVPVGAEITDATLYLYVSYWTNGNDTIHVVRSTADIPLDTDDFSKFDNVSGGSANPSSTNSWMSIDIDAAALDWIVGGDATRLALINDYDLNNIAPEARNDVLLAMSEDSEHRPYLEVTYLVP